MKLKRAGTDATPEQGEQAVPRRSLGNLIPAVVVAVGLVAGGFFVSQNSAGASAEPAEASKVKEAKEESTHGPVQNLDAITLNLADGHFLKIGLALQLADTDDGHGSSEELPSAKALDTAITLLGSYTMDQLSDPKVRELVKKKLSNQVAAAYVDPETHDSLVTTVYFTEFVMQ
jgi:flagellar FliL protein